MYHTQNSKFSISEQASHKTPSINDIVAAWLVVAFVIAVLALVA